MVVGGRELIDTLWNVNVNHIMLYNTCLNELIDTLWNVNFFVQHIFLVVFLELIDTLWNVNLVAITILPLRARINRYIMECKF